MTSISFDTADLLVQYVVTNTIAQAAIVQIVVTDGRWYLFHF